MLLNINKNNDFHFFIFTYYHKFELISSKSNIMKNTYKFLLAIALCLFVFSEANAQKLGIKAGGGLYSITGPDAKDSLDIKGVQPGIHVGIYLKIGPKMVYLQPEVLFSMRGVKTDASQTILGVPITFQSTTVLTYIDIPITLNIKSPTGLGIFFGPVASIMINAKQEVTGSFITGDPITLDKDELAFSNFELGIVAGLKMHFPGGLNFGASYSRGITNIFQAKSDDPLDPAFGVPDDTYVHWGIQAFVGFTFPF